ncbi:hypothetical protein D3C83_116720 [compost metagenome]
MLRDGSPSTATRSAIFPASSVPRSLPILSASAAFLVVVWIASIGFMPSFT